MCRGSGSRAGVKDVRFQVCGYCGGRRLFGQQFCTLGRAFRSPKAAKTLSHNIQGFNPKDLTNIRALAACGGSDNLVLFWVSHCKLGISCIVIEHAYQTTLCDNERFEWQDSTIACYESPPWHSIIGAFAASTRGGSVHSGTRAAQNPKPKP